MSFLVHDVLQRTPEWMALRLGRVTSTAAADMLATVKSGGEAAGRRNLKARLVLERLTNESQELEYQSPAMLLGAEREAEALGQYEAIRGELVQRVGFVTHQELLAGGSPDGIIGAWDGVVEVKAPLAATHLDTLKTGAVPLAYLRQVHHLLWLTELPWCDWLSFHPAFPPSLRVKVVRVTMTAAERDSYELMLRQFIQEIDAELSTVLDLEKEAAYA